jgi:hypothetical protein
MHTFDPLCVSSDLPGVNPATLNRMILYYCLMTKWSGLGNFTELSRMRLSQNRRKRHGGCGFLDEENLRQGNGGSWESPVFNSSQFLGKSRCLFESCITLMQGMAPKARPEGLNGAISGEGVVVCGSQYAPG